MNRDMLSRFYAEIKIVLPLLLIAYFVLSMPYWLRNNDELLIGREAYNYLRAAEQPFNGHDDLSYGGRQAIFNAYPLALNLFSKAFGIGLIETSKILPIIFGLISVLLFYFILKRLELDNITVFVSCIVLILSPPFIYLFTVSNTYIVPVSIALLSFLLLLHDKKFLAYVLLFMTLFFGIVPFLSALGLLAIYSIKNRNYKSLYMLLLLALLLIPIIKMGMPELVGFKKMQEGINFRVQMFISEFGSEIGISMFAVILSLFGLRGLWQKKYEHFYEYLAIILLAMAAFFDIKIIFYLNFFVSILAGIGIAKMINQGWGSLLIRLIIGLMLTMGLVSAMVFGVGHLAKSLPNKEIIESMEFIEKESKGDAVVASYYTGGHWINAIGKRKNVMDENFFYAPDVNQRYDDLNRLFHAKEIERAMEIIEKYNIRYIWTDNAMKNGLVWNEEDEGLLFLLGASNNFKKEYSNDYIEIWKVVG